jgi:hypothetical protein
LKYKIALFFVPIFILLISACSKEEVVKFENKNTSTAIIVQKVINNSSSSDMNKIIKDRQKIQELLTLIEGLKVKKADKRSFLPLLRG